MLPEIVLQPTRLLHLSNKQISLPNQIKNLFSMMEIQMTEKKSDSKKRKVSRSSYLTITHELFQLYGIKYETLKAYCDNHLTQIVCSLNGVKKVYIIQALVKIICDVEGAIVVGYLLIWYCYKKHHSTIYLFNRFKQFKINTKSQML